jgi:hypothetical protein
MVIGLIVVATFLSAQPAAAQNATLTDDGHLSTNANTQHLDFSGQGFVLIVAGASAMVNNSNVGATKTFIKFQLPSSLPLNVLPANVAKATLKLFFSTGTAPAGAIDFYTVTSPWTESTLATAPPTISANPFATAIPVGKADSSLVLDLTAQVQEWLLGSSHGGLDNNGIALLPDTPATFAAFDSKENLATSQPARLEIVLGNSGPPGAAATVQVGTTSTLGPNGQASVANVGTPSAAILNFAIPQGQPGLTGPAGQAATVAVGTTMTVPAGTPASVLNGGTANAAVLNFLVPQGPIGLTGAGGFGVHRQKQHLYVEPNSAGECCACSNWGSNREPRFCLEPFGPAGFRFGRCETSTAALPLAS